MDNLMPHMLSDVAPLITDALIAYLKNGKGARPHNLALGLTRSDRHPR